ncbi:MAG: alkaline phosphatase [Pirellulales bacterium]|nr:alkaline phosphatase [Pirellulales bacterium]
MRTKRRRILAGKGARTCAPERVRRRLGFEHLERRELLSVALPGGYEAAPAGGLDEASSAYREVAEAAAATFGPAAPALPKNVILMIGDGMGLQHVIAARMFLGGEIVFDEFPFQAEVTTHSANASITDSAASGTAMATGQKVNNGVISVATPGDGSDLTTSLEVHRTAGKMTGLVTTTAITNATPATFGAHAASRTFAAEIAADMLTQTRPNVLFGGGGVGMTSEDAIANGYTVVSDRAGMQALATESVTLVSGQFGTGHLPYELDGLGSLPHLSEMTTTALAILDNDPDGMFLMVEGGRIDHAGHINDIERNVRETAEFARAVEIVLDWAAGRADTLVLVTADHETGGLTVLADRGAGVAPEVSWSTGGHTAANVPVYAWGSNAHFVTGVLDNTEIAALTTTWTVESLGPIVAVEIRDLDPSSGASWYSCQTTRQGLLMLQASSPTGAEDVRLTLYDSGYGELATSALVRGGQRIDWPTGVSTTYLIRLSGTGSDVTLKALNPIVEAHDDHAETTGMFAPGQSEFLLSDHNDLRLAQYGFVYGAAGAGWKPIAGDWDGDGADSVGLFNPDSSTFLLRHSLSPGFADVGFAYGPAGARWLPIAGDWDGDGIDSVGLFDPATSTFFVRNALTSGFADRCFLYGPPGAGWWPIAGDWDGDGADSVGLFNPSSSRFLLRNSLTSGFADEQFVYGAAGADWKPIAGDWDGDGADSVGLFNPNSSTFFLRNALSTGYADHSFAYEAPATGWQPIAGDWDGANGSLTQANKSTEGPLPGAPLGPVELSLLFTQAESPDAVGKAPKRENGLALFGPLLAPES